jgi:hypothetical protein
MLAAGLKPLVPYPGNRVPWLSRHECGREVTPQYRSIQQGQGGCSVCAGNEVDLAIVMATMTAAGLTPLESYPGADKPWLCEHDGCGREVRPTYHNIQQGQGGCSVCNRPKIDLEIVMATMAAAGLTPLESYPGAHEPWRCKHDGCGREVKPWYSNIKRGQSGCGHCSGAIPDLEKVFEVMAVAGLTPLESYHGGDDPWRCKHEKCGNEVRPRYRDIKQGGGGCRFCAPYGYNPSKPAYVYLIEINSHSNFPHGVLKIGIAGGKSRRLKQWQRRGWTLLEAFHFDDGEIPITIEDEVLKWFDDDLGLDPCLSADDVVGIGGHTETISVADLILDGFSVDDVRKKVKQLVKMQTPQLISDGVR